MKTVTYTREGPLAVITLNNPPVNAINAELTADLTAALDAFDADQSAQALVIECQGATFVAGGDIAAFDKPEFSTQSFNSQLLRLLNSDRPVIASLFGTVLGGGLELAMACHVRVAAEATQFGMPEVTLGLIPGSFGTQLLPRLVGLGLAAQMISKGKPITDRQALAAGLVDAIAADVKRAAREHAEQAIGLAPRKTHQLACPDDQKTCDAVLSQVREDAEKSHWLMSPSALMEALGGATRGDFAAGIALEARLFADLVRSPQGRALRYVFQAERKAKKLPNISPDTPTKHIETVGIVGAGTMGAGIATAFLSAGFNVVLVDSSEAGLDRGKQIIEGNYQTAVKRGLLSEDQVSANLSRLGSSLDIDAVSDSDLVIEAVYENLDLKIEIARKLGALCKSGAIIATNTSTLDVDKIALATGRPADVVGTHFFSPAHIMRLLEVVRGEQTAAATLKTVMKVAQRIRKTPVVSGVCYGFIGNRMSEVYMRENEALQLSGALPTDIDRSVESTDRIGMAMGPNRMLDMAGVDVGALTVIEWIKGGEGPADPVYRAVCRSLYERGDHGQKTGEGYYRYEQGKPHPSEKLTQLIATLQQEFQVAPRGDLTAQEMYERLLFSMINEAAKILDEGIAYRASDIDVVWTSGYGFPAWRGGPLFMADEIGLPVVVGALDGYAARLGNEFGYWTVSPLLRHLAETNQRISEWRGRDVTMMEGQ